MYIKYICLDTIIIKNASVSHKDLTRLDFPVFGQHRQAIVFFFFGPDITIFADLWHIVTVCFS